MDSYRNKIDSVITEASGEVVLNGSYDHAAIIIERMFSRARSSVRILTAKFDPRIYCDQITVGAAKKMLGDPARSIKILIEDPEAVNQMGNPYFGDMARHRNLEIGLIPEALRVPISINFALMDDMGFRLEKDQTGTSAIVCFGEKNLTPRLQTIFDQVWSQSTKITSQVPGGLFSIA